MSTEENESKKLDDEDERWLKVEDIFVRCKSGNSFVMNFCVKENEKMAKKGMKMS